MKIIGFGTYDRRKHPRAGILLDGLRQLGQEVYELNEPLGFSTDERITMLAKPWTAHRMLLRLVRRWSSLTVQRLRLRGEAPEVVLVGYLGHFDVILARLLFPRSIIALDMLIFAADTARDRGVSNGSKLRLLDGLDSLAVKCASLVIVDTAEHLTLISEAQRHKGVVAPVGAQDEWFVARPEKRSPGPMRVLFFGLFTPLQGATVIGDAISQLGDEVPITFTMIGSGQDLAKTKKRAGGRANVQWLDWVEPADLPELVTSHDVCLGIFADTPKALRVTPNKVFEGAAAGCAILTSDTPPQRRSLDHGARFVPVADPLALADAMRSLAANPDEVLNLGRAAAEVAEREFRPRRVAAPLLEVLISVTNGKSDR